MIWWLGLKLKLLCCVCLSTWSLSDILEHCFFHLKWMEVMCTNIPRKNKLKITFGAKKGKKKKRGESCFLTPSHGTFGGPVGHMQHVSQITAAALWVTHSSNMMQSHCALINLSIIPWQAIQSALWQLGGRTLCVHSGGWVYRVSVDKHGFFFFF